MHIDNEWWRHAVIYQIYPRSFASSSGPVGDLAGIVERLEYVKWLGVDAVWLSPFYLSPQRDGGYDIADYRTVDPQFGDLADVDNLLTRAHELGLRVIVDLVPNHTSDEHEWFRQALADGPGSAARDRYWFRDGDRPPNNWRSIFGGSAWTRTDDGQWYLNLFDSSQPDLNWNNLEVADEFDAILRFWLDRDVDGFRIDVAHGLVKDPALPDWDGEVEMASGSADRAPMFDQEGIHEIYRRWRDVVGEYGPDRILVAEAWVDPLPRLARYVRHDEMHQAFNFDFLSCPWDAAALRRVIGGSLRAFGHVGAPATWVLSNHDVVRHASRMGLAVTGKGPNGIRPHDPQPDPELGLRRAHAATTLMLGLPGSVYLYQGEELGLPEHCDLPDDVRQDPAFFRTEGAEAGRDGCRVPLPWASDQPGFGFSPTGETWLPQPREWAALAVDAQTREPTSTLSLYRRLLQVRREWNLGAGTWRFVDLGENAVAGINSGDGRPDLLVACAVNGDVTLPNGQLLAADDALWVVSR